MANIMHAQFSSLCVLPANYNSQTVVSLIKTHFIADLSAQAFEIEFAVMITFRIWGRGTLFLCMLLRMYIQDRDALTLWARQQQPYSKWSEYGDY